ncbi:MAG: hypothetical protein V2J55_22050 [Candidatus Competibacteraceae bacterium]|jgi:hypothetical protein|nr:hypothetical protein [Candidatus Competibacteraceae bacterium]
MPAPLSFPLSFKEIDTLHQRPKGTAFRAFKRLIEQLREGEHYHYLAADSHRAEIEALRQQGRIYPSTINVVLMTEVGYQLLKQRLVSVG